MDWEIQAGLSLRIKKKLILIKESCDFLSQLTYHISKYDFTSFNMF